MTTNLVDAQAFYQGVFGWTTIQEGTPDQPYVIFLQDSVPVCGLLPLPKHYSVNNRPHWRGYILVEDLNIAIKRITKANGNLIQAPQDIPDIGRSAIVSDRGGAVFHLFQHLPIEYPLPFAPPRTVGHVGWHELVANNIPCDFSFYEELFDWTRTDVIDMGNESIYQMFATQTTSDGGMMTKSAMDEPGGWLYYFTVASASKAVELVQHHGGKVVNGPEHVPSGGWVMHCVDPQGSLFALESANP